MTAGIEASFRRKMEEKIHVKKNSYLDACILDMSYTELYYENQNLLISNFGIFVSDSILKCFIS